MADAGKTRQVGTSELERKLAGVLGRWLQANRSAEKARREALLDRASYDSFPASDPVAPAAMTETELDTLVLDCVIDGDRLTLRCVPQGASATDQGGRGADLEFDAQGPGGEAVHVRVHVQSIPTAEEAVAHSEARLPDHPVHAGPLPGPGDASPSGGPDQFGQSSRSNAGGQREGARGAGASGSARGGSAGGAPRHEDRRHGQRRVLQQAAIENERRSGSERRGAMMSQSATRH